MLTGGYFDVFVEYAKGDVEDILIKITVTNRGPESARLRLLPTIWFRNTWSWNDTEVRPNLHGVPGAVALDHPATGKRWLYYDGSAELLFTENETNSQRLFNAPESGLRKKDGINDYIIHGTKQAVSAESTGTKAAAHYVMDIAVGKTVTVRLRLTNVDFTRQPIDAFITFDGLFAIGFPALASTSMEQGRLASCHMFGTPGKMQQNRIPYGIYTIPEISMVGHTEEQLWMAMYTLNLLAIAMELATHDPAYEDVASKFWEHFIYIAHAMNHLGHGGMGLWDGKDGFFYDVLKFPDGGHFPVKIRSMVGLIPLFAVETMEPGLLQRLPGFKRRMEWFIDNRPDLTANVACMRTSGMGERRLLSIVDVEQLRECCKSCWTIRRFSHLMAFAPSLAITAIIRSPSPSTAKSTA